MIIIIIIKLIIILLQNNIKSNIIEKVWENENFTLLIYNSIDNS